MPANRLTACLLTVVLHWALAGPATAADAAPKGAADLSNASCLSCHGAKKDKIEVPAANGEKRALHQVDNARFTDSVHAQLECINCHTEINDSRTPHSKTAGAKRPDCIQCHLDLSKTLSKFKTGAERHGMLAVVANIEAYKASRHARPDRDDPTRPMASCNDCHNVHEFNVPRAGSPAVAAWRLGVADRCGTCHDSHLAEWSESVHGKAVKVKHDPKAANCADCHSSHRVGPTRSDAVKLAILESCGNCHEDAYRSYRGTYHGAITALGFTYTAKCVDCHGSHNILPSKDESAPTNVNNRLETCQKCHSPKKGLPLATAGFVSFSPHGTTDNFSAYPQIWIANQIMVNLLVGTFGFFWLHTLLWFYREFKEHRRRKTQPHVRIDDLPEVAAQPSGRHFQRFSPMWRTAHLVFALTLMTLTLTGISLFYPEAPWARTLIGWLGGPQRAGLIHRINAVIFAGVFFWHLAYVITHIVRHWKDFKVFGPNSLIPGLQDLKDIVAMFKWFLGLAPRPVFDRWTYWEKFDYWAPFWGVTIIGVSGALLWVPHITASFLPGWVFNVATIFHGEEAFLAVVFLFTVHFFNNHFRPDKFPLDIVMFTGAVPLEELKREHPLQYQRLVESGQLEAHLVPAPSRPMVVGSKILGFTLIVIGLTLLTLVAIGFFSSP
jgi:cytochrome b subunit of formate dehydrogenase